MNNISLRAEVYLLLSEAFKQPTAELAVEQSNIVSFFAETFAKLNYDISPALYENWPVLASDIAALTEAYHQSFVFPVTSRVVPVESIYRRWTNDTSAAVPFASEKGLLMSDYALHMNTLYNAFGISIPHEYQSMPDHICLQLEFAAFLLTNEPDDRFRIFLAEHLNWVEDLLEDAYKQQIPLYYRQLIQITAQFLAEELRRWASLKF